MAKLRSVTSNFTAGEISPRLLGRTDLKKYQNGVAKLENFLVQVHGGIERRPGTKYVATAHGTVDTTSPPRLVEFQYNVEQSYVLEFGVDPAGGSDPGYIRFFRLDTSGEPTLLIDPSTTNPTVITGKPFDATELPNLQFTQSADVLYIFSSTRPMYELRRTKADDSDSTGWVYQKYTHDDGPYLPMNTDEDITIAPDATTGSVQLTASEDLFDITGKDINRVVRIEDDSTGYNIKGVHPGTWNPTGGPSSSGAWEPAASVFVGDGGAMKLIAGSGLDDGVKIEFLKVKTGVPELNDTVYVGRKFADADTAGGEPGDTRIYLYHPDTTEAVGFSSHDGVTDYFSTTINGICRFEKASYAGWGRISAVSSATVCTLDVVDELPTDNATTNFRLGAWSGVTGYPTTGRFYQDRLWSAGSPSEPQTIWSTCSGSYNCFSPNTIKENLVLDSSAITVTLADAQVNEIKYLAGDTSGLIILTGGGEWLGRASNPQAALTPTDLGFQKSSSYGSKGGVPPIRAGTSLLFVQRDGKVIRELTYEFGQDRFVAPNITLLSEHITGNGVKDGAFQQGRSSRAWYVRKDGTLLTLTYEKSEEVLGWHRQKLAESGGVEPEVLSVGTTLDTDIDNIWVLVKRNVNGTDYYFIEMFEKEIESTDSHDTAFYLDCGLTGYDAGGSQTWSGLEHLIGEAVYVLADAVSLGPFTVDGSGVVDLGAGNSPKRVSIGLKYSSVMESLPMSISTGASGELKGKLTRAYKYFVNMYRSLGGSIGTPEQMYPIEYPATTATILNTQLFEVSAPDNSNRETIIRYEQDDSQPSTVLSIVSEVSVGGN